MDETLERLHSELSAAREAYELGIKTLPRDEVKKLSEAVIAANRAISDYIIQGAEACPDGSPPLGLLQPQQGKVPYAYEIGCPSCPSENGVDYRVYGATRDEAVKRFNDGKWTPAKTIVPRGEIPPVE